MGFLDRITHMSFHRTPGYVESTQAHAVLMEEASGTASSQVPDGIYKTGVYPIPPFIKRYEYYDTVGKVQNAVDSFVKGVMKRRWYFEGDDDSEDGRGSKLMEEWAKQYNLSWLMEYIMRDWIICGNNLLGKKDFMPVQITSVSRVIRDMYGNVENYIQVVAGQEVYLNPDDFIHSKFIDTNREPWGRGMFHSLMTTFIDIDGRVARPTLEGYRQMQQDVVKIHHKYASPRIIYAFENINPTTLDNLSQIFRSMKPGDRQAINRIPTMLTETVDGKARFTDSIEWINGEVEAGLQSSSNRMITKPSAMADAREAGKKDDDTALDLMEKIRRYMDFAIIPLVLKGTGIDPSTVHFRWGAADSFELEFPSGLADAVDRNLVAPEEARQIMKDKGWKLRDDIWKKHQNDVKQQFQPQLPPGAAGPKPSLGDKAASAKRRVVNPNSSDDSGNADINDPQLSS